MLLLCFLCFHIHYRIYNKLLLDFNFLNYATLYKDSHGLIGAHMPSQLYSMWIPFAQSCINSA